MGKIQETRKLYKEVINSITKTEDDWISFLNSSSWHFKYDFVDKVLIYAQKPEAKACAEMKEWNNKVRRWVNKDAEGIFVISKDDNNPYPFRLIFDVSDTHNNKGTEYKLWSIKPEYEDKIIETLETTFGGQSKNKSLSQNIIINSYNMVTDNIQDYLPSINAQKKGTELEVLSDDEIKNIVILTVWASVSYMMMIRCGIDPKDKIESQQFMFIKNFNNEKIVTAIGTAISDIAEMGIREIAKTVINLQKEEKNINHTFARNNLQEYSNNKEKSEGGIEDAENRIQTSRKLQNTKFSDGKGNITNWKIRKNEIEVPKRTQESRLFDIIDGQRLEQRINRGSRNSNEISEGNSREISQTRWNDRRIENERSNEMDKTNEQLQISSRGASNEGTNLQLEQDKLNVWRENTDSNIAKFYDDETVAEILNNAPNIIKNRDVIETYLKLNNNETRKEYIKNILGNAYTVYEIDNNQRVGYKTYDNGLLIWKGDYLTRTEECFKDWNEIVDFFVLNILSKENEDIVNNLPTEMEQKQNITEAENASVFNFSQEIIDNVIKKDSQNQTPLKVEIKRKNKNKVEYFDLHPEVPMQERNNYKIRNDELGIGTKKEKYKNNIEAIKVLKQCEEENRYANIEEQKILSKYVGWGGVQEAFDSRDNNWNAEYNELKSLLTEKEYTEAKRSTLTAFYTPPMVIRNIYRALQNMGLEKGNILEPSCGVGNFMGLLPDTLDQCKMYGVELDSISGKIASQLYQKNTIAVKGFEDVELPDSFFDVAVGNVPFGEFKPYDKRYDKNKFLIHDYFFAKTLDKVRPNGVVAFITSKGTLDKENYSVRKYISQRAELIGAIRLPNNTFKANAGTVVTSDIIFLKKRDKITDIEDDWVELGVSEDGIKMNKYFIDHPEMILGNMKMVNTQYGMDSVCEPFENANLEQLLEMAINNLDTEIEDYQIDIEDENETSIPADLSVRNFSYTIVDEQVYYRENSQMYLQELPLTTINRIKSMILLRECVRNLIEVQLDDGSDEEIKGLQAKLNGLYDNFVNNYGLINSRTNERVFSEDSSYYLLCSLEILNENKQFIRKADMFSKRTIKPNKVVTKADNSIDALILSISEKARVDMEYMQNLTGKSQEELIKELEGSIYKDPIKDEYVTADEYLSGNVREKLKIAKRFAENDPEYEINVKALEQVKIKDLSASEISVRLGATWIPPSDVEEFMFELLETNSYKRKNIKVHYSDYTSEWNISGKSEDIGNIKAINTYGTARANAYKIIETTLNLKDIRIFDTIIDIDGKEQRVLNTKETAIAQAKQDLIKSKFEDWIWKDQARRERLVTSYNDKFNNIRPREYDGQYITFGGMNPEISLRKHQTNAIAHILYGGNTLLAHEVGAGKTFEMVAGAMETKRLGLASKSLFVVPNHIIEQFASEFLQLYPSANILVATKKDFATNNRKKFCSKIATGEYDAIIIGHSQFEKIPMSQERQEKILQKQINDLSLGITDLKNNNGEYYSIKQLEKSKEKVEEKLKRLNDQTRKDNVITFEQLGCDRIFVDEAHYFKNLFLFTKMRNVGGIAQTEAQKSSDLFMKCQYLDELTGGKGIVFATGTPISNSMVEMYTMQRYLQYKTLEGKNLLQFDAWASTFGETVTAIELAPERNRLQSKNKIC